jgi:hypothetical protein
MTEDSAQTNDSMSVSEMLQVCFDQGCDFIVMRERYEENHTVSLSWVSHYEENKSHTNIISKMRDVPKEDQDGKVVMILGKEIFELFMQNGIGKWFDCIGEGPGITKKLSIGG